MAPNVDGMVREAIRAFKAGKKSEARTILEKATDLDPHNEKAWMWLSAAVEAPEDQRICLENVLFINPENENARRGLDYLAKQIQDTPAPPPAHNTQQEEIIDDGFPDSDQTAALFDDPTPAANEGYNVPTSSASSSYDTSQEPTSDVYDDWVAGLNLGSSDDAPTTTDSSAPVGFDYDDDLFADPFGADEDDSDLMDDFASDANFDTSFDSVDTSMTTGPFDAADDLLDDFSANDLSLEESEEVDEIDALLADLDAPPSQSAEGSPPVMSPEPTASEQTASSRRKNRRKAAPLKDGVDDELYFGGENIDTNDPSEYFRAIPPEIKATRLPGMAQSTMPRSMLIGLVALVVANIGALGLLALNMAS